MFYVKSHSGCNFNFKSVWKLLIESVFMIYKTRIEIYMASFLASEIFFWFNILKLLTGFHYDGKTFKVLWKLNFQENQADEIHEFQLFGEKGLNVIFTRSVSLKKIF